MVPISTIDFHLFIPKLLFSIYLILSLLFKLFFELFPVILLPLLELLEKLLLSLFPASIINRFLILPEPLILCHFRVPKVLKIIVKCITLVCEELTIHIVDSSHYHLPKFLEIFNKFFRSLNKGNQTTLNLLLSIIFPLNRILNKLVMLISNFFCEFLHSLIELFQFLSIFNDGVLE